MYKLLVLLLYVYIFIYLLCHYHSLYPGDKRTNSILYCDGVILNMFDGDESGLVRSGSSDHGSADGENTLLRETRLDGVRIHPGGQSEALTETLGAAAPAVRGFLLVFGLHYDGVVHSPDEQLLRLVFLNIDDYLQLFRII